jgi:LAO/AO transport system kinase
MMNESSRQNIAPLVRGIRAGDRAVLARAITLIESRRADHRRSAARLLQDVMPVTGNAARVGITGSPGVGKSTTIDALGAHLTGLGRRVAVLAVDPSSSRTGGSILADKTRMARLATDANAFIRPSRRLVRSAASRPGRARPCCFARLPVMMSSSSKPWVSDNRRPRSPT